MGRKVTQYPNNVSVTPDELSLLDLSEKTGVAIYESRKWTLTQFKAWLNANITIPSVDGTQGQIPLFVQDDEIGSNTRFTFIDNEGTEVGFRFSDSAGNLTQAGVTYLNVESNGIASNSVLRLANWADNENKGIISFRKSRGTKTTPTQVLTNDILGHIIYAGQSNFGSGTTTAIVEVVAKQNYNIETDLVFGFVRNALTEFRIFLAPSESFNGIPSGFSNEKVFSVDGDGNVSFKYYTFPVLDGLANQVLKTDGAGQLSWSTPAIGLTGSGTLNKIAKFTPNGTTLGDSKITEDGTSIIFRNVADTTDIFTFNLSTAQTSIVNSNNNYIQYIPNSNSFTLSNETNMFSFTLRNVSDNFWQHIRFLRFRANGSQPLNGDILGSIGHLGHYNFVLEATENHNSITQEYGKQIVLGGTQNGQNVAQRTLILTQDNKVKISDAFHLPNTDGTNGQVLTTNGAGSVSWASNSGTSGRGFSPMPISMCDTAPTAATTQYYYQTVAEQSMTLSKMKIYGYSGSDLVRVGVYRGSLETGCTLIGQGSATCGLGSNEVHLTAESGQNLNVSAGEDLVVGFYANGISFRTIYRAGISDLNFAISNTADITTMPTTPTGTGTTVRFACTLY